MTVSNVNRPRVRRTNGPGGGGLGKQVSDKTTGTGEHLREDEELLALGAKREGLKIPKLT